MVLKNKSEFLEWANDTELKESKDKTGKVPSAKANIINNPVIKFPLARAEICIDCVNPHGKKNVPIPNAIGARW